MSGGTSWAQAKANEAKAQRLYEVTKPKNLVPSRTYVNAAIREPYTGNNMGTSRDGANDFQQVQSVRMDAQIRRAV